VLTILNQSPPVWTAELTYPTSVCSQFSSPSDEVEDKLYKLQSAANKEDLLESKTSFVALVDALKVCTLPVQPGPTLGGEEQPVCTVMKTLVTFA